MYNFMFLENEESRKSLKKRSIKNRVKQIGQECFPQGFNDPIYAGLDEEEEPPLVNNWGHWMVDEPGQKKSIQKISEPLKKKKVRLAYNPTFRHKRHTNSKEDVKIPVRPPPRNFPVMQRSPSSMKQIHFEPKEPQKQLPNLSQKKRNNFQVRSVTKLDFRKQDIHLFKNPGSRENSERVGRFVYNYCYDNDNVDFLIDYPKLLERKQKLGQIKDEMSSTKGGYWQISKEERLKLLSKLRKL